MAQKSDIEMSVATRRKIMRAAIRLQTSIDADYKINAALGVLDVATMKELQSGSISAIPSLKELVALIDEQTPA